MSAPQYELLYHPGIPGRGEFIRLAFQAAGVSYTDPANDDPPNKSGANGYGIVQSAISQQSTGEDGNPPAFSPPALRVPGAGKGGKPLLIHQTPNILLYLGPKLGLVGSEEQDLYYVNQLTLTALDLNNETHDTHHPVAVMKYYEGLSSPVRRLPRCLANCPQSKRKKLSKKQPTFERPVSPNSSPILNVHSKETNRRAKADTWLETSLHTPIRHYGRLLTVLNLPSRKRWRLGVRITRSFSRHSILV